MEKRIIIEGMSCGHCTARVEKALNALPGVSARVDLQGADVTIPEQLGDEALRGVVEAAGYSVVSIA